uniref:Nucleotide PPase n=1 Tax=Macrostomum lignano TaxID=282301 RepID=A0A1I8GEC7_9PLAT
MLIRALPVLSKLRIVLGSQSPRRRELLERAGLSGFAVVSSQVDESLEPGALPRDAVLQIARRKCRALANSDNPAIVEAQLILCADTVVVIDNGRRIVSKPEQPDVAKQMLRELSGQEHQVLTAVCVAYRRCSADAFAFDEFVESTSVVFGQLDDMIIDWYVSTGEPLDKAGGYGIQGLGCSLVESIQGDYYNVMGLPVHRLGCYLDRICRDTFV